MQVEWLQPYTDAKIRELGAAGVRGLLAVPISFVSEHIETLEEIDMEYRELAHESGIPAWGRVPALNTNATFIDDLADLVLEKLPSTALRLGAVSPAEDHNLGPPSGARAQRSLPSPAPLCLFWHGHPCLASGGGAAGEAAEHRAAPGRCVARRGPHVGCSGVWGCSSELHLRMLFFPLHNRGTGCRGLGCCADACSAARRPRGRAAAGVRPRAARAAAARQRVAVGLDKERGDLERAHRCAPSVSAPAPSPACLTHAGHSSRLVAQNCVCAVDGLVVMLWPTRLCKLPAGLFCLRLQM